MSVSFHIINPHQSKQLIRLIQQQIVRIKQKPEQLSFTDIKLLQAQLLKLQQLINPTSKPFNQASFFHLKQTKLQTSNVNAAIQFIIKLSLQLLDEMIVATKTLSTNANILTEDLNLIAKQLTLLTNSHFSNSTKVNSNPDFNLI